MAGSLFSQAVLVEGSRLTAFSSAALGELGLAIDADTGVIRGVPAAAGEHRLRVLAQEGSAPVEIEVQLIVNADPRSLWLEVEPPADAPHPKPHVETLRLTGDFLVVGASKRGRSHAHGGTFREDHLGARIVGPWHLLAVADGAGSAALSRLGSAVAVKAALDALEASVSGVVAVDPGAIVGPVMIAAARAAAQALDDRAAAAAIDRRELSTTLILAVVRRVEEGIFTAALGIGDGGAGIVDVETGAFATLTVPDGGEFAGQTRFLDQAAFADRIADRLRIDVRPGFSALMLMSDGITDAHLPTDAAFASFEGWAALWNDVRAAADLAPDNPAAADQLLAWLDFWSRGNHDDRTLLVLVP